MTLEGTPVAEIAETLGLDPAEVTRRIGRMVNRLKVDVPAPRHAG